MKRVLLAMLAAVTYLLAGEAVSAQTATTTTTTTTTTTAADELQLHPGDLVRITVWRQPELSGEFVVTPDGYVSHPIYRTIRVTGRPLSEVETQFREFLKAQYLENPNFVLQPILRVAVSGEVLRPDVYSVPPGTSVAQVVVNAGGIKGTGRRDRVRLLRDGHEIALDMSIASGGQRLVRSGDEIVVDPQKQWFRSVVLPTATVLGAIASLVIAIKRN